jgi:hypothetical protein
LNFFDLSPSVELFGGPLESYDRVRLQVVVDIKIPKIKTFDETTVHHPLQFVWRDGMASAPLKYYRALHSISAAGKLRGNTPREAHKIGV